MTAPATKFSAAKLPLTFILHSPFDGSTCFHCICGLPPWRKFESLYSIAGGGRTRAWSCFGSGAMVTPKCDRLEGAH